MSTFGKYLLSNLNKTPYDFINIEYQLISFEKAEKLNEIYEINASLEIRTNAWVYDLFLKGTRLYYEKVNREIKAGSKDQPAFYLEKKVVQDQYCWFLLKNKIINKREMTQSLLGKLKKSVITYKNNKKYYTTDEFMNLEKKLGEMILDLYHEESSDDVAVKGEIFCERDILQHIDSYESKRGFKFTESQKKAIRNGIQKTFSIITGYPGAGKTTVCDCIIAFKQNNSSRKNICLMSPTGLAVKNLRKNCKSYKDNKYLVGTNHKMIYNMFDKIYKHGQEEHYRIYDDTYVDTDDDDDECDTDKKNFYENMPLSVDHIILDEASMIDIFIFKIIIKYCKLFKCNLVLVGDINQLPPINYGAPFAQIINSEIFEDSTTELKEIKRNNGILSENIIKLNEHSLKISDFDNKEMVFMSEHNFSDNNLSKILMKIKQDHKGERIHFMASQNLKDGGVSKLNKILQELYNPDGLVLISGFEEYRVGDKIIRTENDYSGKKMRVNGDRATLVWDSNCGYNEVCVQYDDDGEREKKSFRDFWDNFTHFYASTIHKMEGSEMDIIVLVMPFAHKFMWTGTADSKKLLYTAISRCKKKCIIIGVPQLFRKAQQPKKEDAIHLFMKEFESWE